MQQESLEQIVSKLISLKQEGDFWDFKKEWQTDNKKADLIKDIICFANSIHKRDCYLIFGVNDTYNITGMEQKRWKQADIIDLLSKLKWAEGNIPHISVKTITLNDTLIDVLIVHNSDHVPFYLDADYKCDKFSLRQGVIYSRYKDRNTAWGEVAMPCLVEKLWRKRFHLYEPIIEQLYNLLKYEDEWDVGPNNILYHRYRPEFTIAKNTFDSPMLYEEFFVEYMPNPQANSHVFQLKYHESVLKNIDVLYLDGCRFLTPFPQIESNNTSISGNRYFYMTQDSTKWYLQQIFNKASGERASFSQEIFLNHIVLFKSAVEKNLFSKWCDNQAQLVSEMKEELKIEFKFKYESFAKDAFSTILVKSLLQKYRETIKT